MFFKKVNPKNIDLTIRVIFDDYVSYEEDYIAKRWYDNQGRLHRNNEPAVIWRDGTKAWYKHGKLHRKNGPALVASNGHEEYSVYGIKFSKEEFEEYVSSKSK